MKTRILAAAVLFLGLTVASARAQTLTGSSNSIGYQFIYAHTLGLTFFPTRESIRASAEEGILVLLTGNEDYKLCNEGKVCYVSHPFVLPEVRDFVEVFARKFRSVCGDKLVVTSAARPLDMKLDNSHPDSVHPTGMTVDFREPTGACRTWMEGELLSLESAGIIDATKEKNPKHYHVPVFIDKFPTLLAERE